MMKLDFIGDAASGASDVFYAVSPTDVYIAPNHPLVLAHGCFDLLHLGHIRHLQEAKEFGSYLVVSVTSDRYVNKGAGRPYFTDAQRAEALRALSFVDEVRINDAPDAVELIKSLCPDFYVKGGDYEGVPDERLALELEALEEINGTFVTTKSGRWSSSRLLTSEKHGAEVNDYITHARESGFLSSIVQAFEKVKSLKVAFVGEIIIDEYVYGTPLSKPSKEFVLAMAQQSRETFAGGILAAASHLRGLCETKTVTQLSDRPLTKTRFVDQGFTRKLFELYTPSHLELSQRERDDFHARLKEAIDWADVVIVIDFGHGLIDRVARARMGESKFLAINAQTNAGNQGFNPVTKYFRADYVCVDLPEARLAAQDAEAAPDVLTDFIERKLGGAEVIVTHGREGSYWKGGRVPAISVTPIDTMGAGDCFLAFTAPLIAAGLGVEEAAFVGNVAGSMKTEIVGHRQSVNPQTLLQTVRSLLQ